MPTYPIKHKETGETKQLSMTMKEYDQWRKDNPDWDKDWSQGTGGGMLTHRTQNKMVCNGEVLDG